MSKEIANYEEQLRQMAEVATALEKPSGSSITVRAGVLSYNGAQIPGNKLDAIIIASTHANFYYEGKFDPDNIKSPVCYAYGKIEDDMVPHPKAEDPQAKDCESCPHNKWGSAEEGRGKACKNSRVLALIPADTKPDKVADAEIAILKLPVMSVKNWANYVQKCAAIYNRPPLGLVTQLGTVPDQKSQFKITFTDVKPVDREYFAGLFDRVQTAEETMCKVYEQGSNESAPQTAKKKGKMDV